MMTEGIKDLAVKHLDAFLEEIKPLLDGEFILGDATAVHFADAIEVVWNAMGYSAKLEVDEIFEFEPDAEDIEEESKG